MKVQEETYSIPARFRRIENLHIFIWLIKDSSWANEWKILGTIMIFPTLAVAMYILWNNRNNRSETFHNIAVCFWIIANSTWMMGEFLSTEANKLDLRPQAAILFYIGIITIAIHYVLEYMKHRQYKKRMKNVVPIPVPTDSTSHS